MSQNMVRITKQTKIEQLTARISKNVHTINIQTIASLFVNNQQAASGQPINSQFRPLQNTAIMPLDFVSG